MAINVETLAAAMAYTKKSIEGGGAVAGKNCTIESIVPITGGNRVTFKWYLDDGEEQTGTMDVMDGVNGTDGKDGKDGVDGIGIASVSVTEENHLMVTYTDESSIDAGLINVLLDVDSELSDVSENPVQNKVVKSAIDAKANKDGAEVKTAVDEFETYNGGLLSECKVALSPNQDLHGYSEPWVGGAGKNKMPLTVENLKAWNTGEAWSGNTQTVAGMSFTVLTDDANNVIGIDENGITTSYPTLTIFSGTLNGSYTLCKDNARSRVYVNGSQVNDGTSDYSFTASGETYEIKLFTGAVTLDHQIVKPMLVLSTESDATFAPYSNICPISGHTQVDVDVSDGQTTQEQVTVNLGGTYYSGTLDVVSGVLTVDTVAKTYNGTENWVASNNGYYLNVPLSDAKASALAISNLYKYNATTWTSGCFGITASKTLWVGNTNLLSVISANNLFVVYELATPTPIQLSPTMVKALVGENHLSAPLEGQEITESKYRELFTWDEVEEIAQKIATSAVADLRCYQVQNGTYGLLAYVEDGTVFYDWGVASPSVKMLSTISVMSPLDEIEFTDSSIYSNSICELIVVGDSDVPVVTHVKVTSGKVVFTLSEALDNTIQCACKVTNRNL